MKRLSIFHPDKGKQSRDRAEECLTLSREVTDPQAREAYERLAEAYLALAGASEKPRLSLPTKRPRTKQIVPLKERLTSFALQMREKALKLPPGAERDDLLKRARLADTTSHIDDWTTSSGLLPPE
jgi:hypothetical protein